MHDDHVGTTLGQYHIQSLLGAGGCAKVYLGEHLHLGTRAAIKVMRNHMSGEEEKKHFREEARIIAQLKHPNILPVLDFGIEPIPYLVMEYISHGSLRERHPRGTRLPLVTIVLYVQQIATALHHAHQNNVIHRDVKPENILMNEHGNVVLSDFGIAVVAHNHTASLTLQQIGGTPSYMAPEQIQGKARQASDQYALGIMVYEWLCGTVPFRGDHEAICMQHLHYAPPSLKEYISGVPSDVERIVMRALAKDPKQRFESISAFATALERASGLVAQPPTQRDIAEISTVKERSDLSVTEIARSQNGTRGATQCTYTLHSDEVVALAWSPDGKHIASGSFDKKVHIWEAETGANLSMYEGHTDRVSSVAWSSNGRSIASASWDGSVQIWEATNGNRRDVLKKYRDVVVSIAYSPDGKFLAVGCRDRTVRVLNALSGKSVYIYKRHVHPVLAVAWFASESRLLASSSEGKTVRIWSWNKEDWSDFEFGFDTEVTALACSPHETRFACALDGETTVLIKRVVDQDNPDADYEKHKGIVNAIAWSPHGKYIASASDDNTVQIWDAKRYKHIYTYKGHSGGVRALAWSPDSKRIASASDDNSVKVWWAA